MLSNMSQKIDQVSQLTEKQGIVTILGSDMERTGAAASASLRRTLSADMSNNKWLAQNGVPPLKKSPSSRELYLPKTVMLGSSSSSSGEDVCERSQDEIWTSIQQDKMNKKNNMMQGLEQDRSDIWSSIISQKDCELITSKSVPSPYIHPLVKRSQSSLSEKSLEICTESLGSETGSDGFSSNPRSETGDAEDQDKEEEQDQQKSYDAAEEDFSLAKYNHAAATKKVTPSPFPPPLPSLSHSDGASLQMRTVREDGRLVVEAVSVPSQKHFHAERQDGRLLLTFVDGEEPNEGDGDEQVHDNHGLNEQEKYDIDDLEEQFAVSDQYDEGEKDHVEDEYEGAERELELEDEEVETKDIEIVIEDGIRNMSSTSVTNVHRLMLKPCVLNRNLSWSQKFNEVVKFEETEEEKVKVNVMKATPVAQSLPPKPKTTRLIPSSTPVGSTTAGAPGSLNAYEYYWKPRPTTKAETQIFNQFIKHQESSQLYNSNDKFVVTKNVQTQNDRKQVIVLRGKNGEYLVPMSKTCKESRTSVLYLQPYCIASS